MEASEGGAPREGPLETGAWLAWKLSNPESPSQDISMSLTALTWRRGSEGVLMKNATVSS